MINREMKSVSVISYAPGTDSYGQPRKVESGRKTVEMLMKIYTQNNVSDIRYNDVTTVGLTKDNSITDANVIDDGVNTYSVLYTIPSPRFNTILMKKL